MKHAEMNVLVLPIPQASNLCMCPSSQVPVLPLIGSLRKCTFLTDSKRSYLEERILNVSRSKGKVEWKENFTCPISLISVHRKLYILILGLITITNNKTFCEPMVVFITPFFKVIFNHFFEGISASVLHFSHVQNKLQLRLIAVIFSLAGFLQGTHK